MASAQRSPTQLADMAADTLLGRGDGGGPGAPQEITLGANLSMAGAVLSATSGGVTDGDKGDVVVSGGGTAWAIDTAYSRARLEDVKALASLHP